MTKGFENVNVRAEGGGNAIAELVDLKSADILFAAANQAVLSTSHRQVTIENFPLVRATADDTERPIRDVRQVDFILETFGSWLRPSDTSLQSLLL